MRLWIWICAVVLSLVASGVGAANLDWPNITLGYARADGYFMSGFQFRDSHPHVTIKEGDAQALSAEIATGRGYLRSQWSSWPGHQGINSTVVEGRLTTIRIGAFHQGFGFWYSHSRDNQQLFSSGSASIVTTGTHEMTAVLATLGVGDYDRSYIRAGFLYGTTSAKNSLDLEVSGKTILSPLTTESHATSRFRGGQGDAAIRHWGFSLEGSVIGMAPIQPSGALPGQGGLILTGSVSYVTPLHIGAFYRYTRVLALPAIGTQSLQPWYDSSAAGVVIALRAPK